MRTSCNWDKTSGPALAVALAAAEEDAEVDVLVTVVLVDDEELEVVENVLWDVLVEVGVVLEVVLGGGVEVEVGA